MPVSEPQPVDEAPAESDLPVIKEGIPDKSRSLRTGTSQIPKKPSKNRNKPSLGLWTKPRLNPTCPSSKKVSKKKAKTIKQGLSGPEETVDKPEQAVPQTVDEAPPESDLTVIKEVYRRKKRSHQTGTLRSGRNRQQTGTSRPSDCGYAAPKI